MANHREVLRAVDWRGIFPWLVIFRTFRLAKSIPVIVLATLGAWLTPVGWHIAEKACLGPESVQVNTDFGQIVMANRKWPSQKRALPAPNSGRIPTSPQEILASSPDTLQPLYLRFTSPFRGLLDTHVTLRQAGYYTLGIVWNLIVWGLLGGAITRIAAVRLGREQQIGLSEAVRFACGRFGWYVASPLFPLCGVVLVALPILGLGWLMWWDWGLFVAGLFWIFATLGGFCIAVLLLGLLFGWPLMWVTVSAEEQGDAFEAFSRCYSYVFQRPLHYLFYALIGCAFGALSWLLVYHFAEAVIMLTAWPAQWIAGDRWQEVESVALGLGTPSSSAVAWGGLCIGWCMGLVRSLAVGFAYGFFWCLATAIYLLLRQDLDHTEFDEVYLPDEDRGYQLPELDGAVEKPSDAAS